MQASAYVRFKPDTEERSTYLYRAYTKWCEDNLESPVPQKKFSQFLLKNAGKYGLTFSKHIEGKFAFVKRSETMKSPVGTLSDRTVLRSKMEGLCPDKLNFCAAKYTLCKRCKDFTAFSGAMEGTRTPGLLIRSARRAIPSIFGSYVLPLFLSDKSQVLNFEFLHPLSDFATICTLCTF